MLLCRLIGHRYQVDKTLKVVPTNYCTRCGELHVQAKLQELVRAADALTAIGHGLKLDEPVNAGSLAWADSAFRVLEKLAARR